ncbi:MAG TPA: ribosomal protein S18-alanine N-acetyltransferase [Pyrinomonadaceae bacterium]|nr:ribosomal protein S18-alanine N-acetyltransferase [Pyrinomonadaceae bacterium]
MASAREVAPGGPASLAAERMSEHDLLEVVEIEETTGLSLWGWDAYRSELDRPEAIMLVVRGRAGAGPSVVGFIAARCNLDEVHVNNIGVRHGYRRRGVGGALLGAALAAAAGRGAREAILEVRASNLDAQALYARFGFKVVGRRKNYYRDPPEDALVMTRRLGTGA